MIVYTDPTTGNVHACSLMSSVPEGIVGYEVTAPSDRQFRDAWVLNAGALAYNVAKAKEIAHNQRRASRQVEMLPLDEEERFARTSAGRKSSIAVAKEVILTKYDDMQVAIDDASSIAELKAAL